MKPERKQRLLEAFDAIEAAVAALRAGMARYDAEFRACITDDVQEAERFGHLIRPGALCDQMRLQMMATGLAEIAGGRRLVPRDSDRTALERFRAQLKNL